MFILKIIHPLSIFRGIYSALRHPNYDSVIVIIKHGLPKDFTNRLVCVPFYVPGAVVQKPITCEMLILGDFERQNYTVNLARKNYNDVLQISQCLNVW